MIYNYGYNTLILQFPNVSFQGIDLPSLRNYALWWLAFTNSLQLAFNNNNKKNCNLCLHEATGELAWPHNKCELSSGSMVFISYALRTQKWGLTGGGRRWLEGNLGEGGGCFGVFLSLSFQEIIFEFRLWKTPVPSLHCHNTCSK